MKHLIKSVFCSIFAIAFLSACSNTTEEDAPAPAAKDTPMTFEIRYPGQTRVTGNAFERGDKIGLFVAGEDAPLEIGGNLVNNEAITFDGNTWAAGRTLYWDDGTFNAYAYYPYQPSISSVSDLPFSISTDQRTDEGYENSDLLYARATGIKASGSPIQLTFGHLMSKLRIRLVKGEDFEGEMPDDAQVYIHNVYPSATIDLSAGVATVNGRSSYATVIARADGNHTYSAIIVPQRRANRMPLVEVVMKGVSYLFESNFVFKTGVQHTVNLIISDNPDQVKIEVGGEVQDWQ